MFGSRELRTQRGHGGSANVWFCTESIAKVECSIRLRRSGFALKSAAGQRESMESQRNTLSGTAEGFAFLNLGARMLFRERRLWLLAAVPIALSLAAFSAAIGFVVGNATFLHEFAAGWLPSLEAQAWYAWLWIGPAKGLLWTVGWLMFLAIAAGCLVLAFVLASLLAAPFHDALSARVEEIQTGAVRDDSGSGFVMTLAGIGRSLFEELRRLLFFAMVVGPLAVVGLVVPGAQFLTGPAIVAFTILFLPLDYASYTLDRRLLTFAEKRQWVFERIPTMLGFGGGAFLIYLVPGINFVAMPLLVVSGTLLCLAQPARPSGIEGSEAPQSR